MFLDFFKFGAIVVQASLARPWMSEITSMFSRSSVESESHDMAEAITARIRLQQSDKQLRCKM